MAEVLQEGSVLRIQGAATVFEVEKLRDDLTALLALGLSPEVLDLRALSSLDAAGAQVLLSLRRQLKPTTKVLTGGAVGTRLELVGLRSD